MNTEIIEYYKNIIVHISTPYGTGTGFYLKKVDLIITNEHVIRNNKTVVIEGDNLPDLIKADVVYVDSKYDLAFLKPDGFITDIEVSISNRALIDGESVLTLGHPFDLKFTATNGIVSKAIRKYGDIDYIQTDAPINPGNSGGPLVDGKGDIVGINTFIIKDSNNLGFALSTKYLTSALDDFLVDNVYKCRAIRCRSCENTVHENDNVGLYCKYCGDSISFIKDIVEYVPQGARKGLEDILESIGLDILLSRRGSDNWELKSGSATLAISYNEDTGFFKCESVLVKIPKANIKELYTYMLKQNFINKRISFSLDGQFVILSTMLYDRYLDKEVTKGLINELLQEADCYDNLFVDKFGAIMNEN